MSVPFKMNVGALSVALALAGIGFSAQAALERVGPVPPLSTNPEVGGFPAWYQDRTGVALEFCAPVAAEVADAWCLIGPPEFVGRTAPEAFPGNFFDEHFYYAASATLNTGLPGAVDSSRVQLILAQEAAFTSGSAAPDQQVVFSRLRLRFNAVPVTGNYRFLHPYGEQTIFAEAGTTIFFTDDVGISCGTNFACSITSQNMGPFLLPSLTPGGAELPPVTAANPAPDTVNIPGGVATAYPGTGKAYIADPARIGPVTGGPVRNFFRVEAPPGSNLNGAGATALQTANFALMGRMFDGVIPGRVTVDRASYANSATERKLDVFATAVPTRRGRTPGAPQVAGDAPVLAFHDQPCTGVADGLGGLLPPFGPPAAASVPTPLKTADTLRWAQIQPGAAIPTGVCVRETVGAANVYHPATVKDEVKVTQAHFNPGLRTLAVDAGSSETIANLTLRLAYGAALPVELVNGRIVVPELTVPPPNAEVQSTRLGVARYRVSTGYATAAAAGTPTAANDTFTIAMNTVEAPTGTQPFAVQNNDAPSSGGALALVSQPALGSASVSGGTVNYSPRLNASGTDTFTYTLTTAGGTSNTALVTVNITPVNVAPVANNDAYNAIANSTASLNVLGNDTDVNGTANIVAPVEVSAITGPAGASATVNGRNIDFRATTQGNYSFTYRARDAGIGGSAPRDSNLASVSVAVSAQEVLTFVRSEYRRDKSRLVVEGSVSPGMGQAIALDWVNSSGTAIGRIATVNASTATAPAVGTWVLDTAVAAPAAAVSVRATTPNGAVLNSAINFR
jgi:Bacterial Ig domain